MALRIEEKNDVFFLDGILNSDTSQVFKKHMDFIMETNGYVTINIDKLNEIDLNGLSVLKQFYRQSNKNAKDFFIVGYGCKEIYGEFKYDQSA
ncbi:STAS domain-containing protein [Psychroserpens sp.]|uniref:STAS domain-containing protein n=1 Tax=Psychroserpens sp. TaxID=2020870 RepID=UPI001B1BD7DD|nr:STAS domain-containing protein [Psychroserpens sp.]MBO6605720.1 anti-sigma factor antagonist [Psychroserpens sp.]MBO6630300.1 anti-sigma factor antagonist [Psychroserpens sp.]MBO6652909.1 anti-sigma factor antagonist [Psychroserpens sp.]MBO6681319.1 anti-sigma factor antagonist [Psychroserpens sp.]MBO6749094.1 anti-sigma factor antagonist [Psychroserpens sp.]